MKLSLSEIARAAALIQAGQVDAAAADATTRPDPARIISFHDLIERRRAAVTAPYC